MADALAELIKIANQVVFIISGIFRANAVTGTGGTLFGGLNTLTLVVSLALTAVLVWKVGETIIHWVQDAEGHFRPDDVKSVMRVVLFYVLMLVVAPWGQISVAAGMKVDTGEVAGVCYSSITEQLDAGTKSAIRAIRAVDTVMAYEEFMHEAAEKRRTKIYESLAESDPRMKALWERRKAKNGGDLNNGQLKGGFIDNARTMFTIAATAVDAAVSGKGGLKGLVTLIPSSLANMAGYYFFLFIAWTAYFWFSWTVVKGVVIFTIYVKIATFLALILLPAAVGLSYFQSLRGFAISMARHLVVLLVLSNVMGAAYTAIFNQEQIKSAIAMGLRDSQFARASAANEQPSASELLAMRVGLLAQDVIPSEEANRLMTYSTSSIGDANRVAQSVMRVVAVLGVMVLFISKLYEVINGALEGSFDASDVLRREATQVGGGAGSKT